MDPTSDSIISDCFEKLIRRFHTVIFCLTLIAMFCAIFTFIAYSVRPRLKNLQGSILRGYLTSCIGSMFLTVILCSAIQAGYLQNSFFVEILVAGIWYFSVTSMFWLNVMGFDIWLKYRKSASSQDIDVSGYQVPIPLPYSIYAWGNPAFILMIAYGLVLLSDRSAMVHILLIMMLLPIGGILLCNMSLFISTILTIKKCAIEKVHIDFDTDMLNRENEEWFISYVTLFGTAQIPLILLVAAIVGNIPTLAMFVGTLSAALQGFSSFVIFSGCKDIGWSFRKPFDGSIYANGLISST